MNTMLLESQARYQYFREMRVGGCIALNLVRHRRFVLVANSLHMLLQSRYVQ